MFEIHIHDITVTFPRGQREINQPKDQRDNVWNRWGGYRCRHDQPRFEPGPYNMIKPCTSFEWTITYDLSDFYLYKYIKHKQCTNHADVSHRPLCGIDLSYFCHLNKADDSLKNISRDMATVTDNDQWPPIIPVLLWGNHLKASASI